MKETTILELINKIVKGEEIPKYIISTFINYIFNTDQYYLDIEIKRSNFILSSLILPPFYKNTMYNKLQLFHKYNIKDLGLFED